MSFRLKKEQSKIQMEAVVLELPAWQVKNLFSEIRRNLNFKGSCICGFLFYFFLTAYFLRPSFFLYNRPQDLKEQ